MLSMQAQKTRAMVLDIAPKSYPRGHDQIFKSLFHLKLDELVRRDDADLILQTEIKEHAVRQFLLKNLDKQSDGRFKWEIQSSSLFQNYNNI